MSPRKKAIGWLLSLLVRKKKQWLCSFINLN